jgi:hypothetical protein
MTTPPNHALQRTRRERRGCRRCVPSAGSLSLVVRPHYAYDKTKAHFSTDDCWHSHFLYLRISLEILLGTMACGHRHCCMDCRRGSGYLWFVAVCHCSFSRGSSRR